MATKPVEYDFVEYTDGEGDTWVYDRNSERLLFVKCNMRKEE